MKANPFGEELMILNGQDQDLLAFNPARRRRGGRRRRSKIRVRVSIPKRNPVRRHRRGRRPRRNPVFSGFLGRKYRRGRNPVRRYRLNPVSSDTMRVSDVPKVAIFGLLGAGAGGGGYYASKWILPAEYDQHPAGYALHGLVGTVGALAAGWGAGKMGFRGATKIMVGAAWATVLFRALLNHVFNKAARPAPLVPVSAKAKLQGLEGIEGSLPLGYDLGQDDIEEMGEYDSPQPYDLGDYSSPEPYDLGRAGGRRLGNAPQRRAASNEDVPELGKYSKRPESQWTPLWGSN